MRARRRICWYGVGPWGIGAEVGIGIGKEIGNGVVVGIMLGIGV